MFSDEMNVLVQYQEALIIAANALQSIERYTRIGNMPAIEKIARAAFLEIQPVVDNTSYDNIIVSLLNESTEKVDGAA